MGTWDPKSENVLPPTLRKILRQRGGTSYARQIRIRREGSKSEKTTCNCAASETRRRIPPSHSNHVTGRYPMGDRGGPVRFESGLELDFIRLMDSYPEVEELWTQPLTVACFCKDHRLVYTTDCGVRFSSEEEVPVELKTLGFEEITLVEVKPESRIDERVTHRLELLKTYTGLQTLLITDVQIRALLKGRACDGR